MKIFLVLKPVLMMFRDEHDRTFTYQSRVDKALIDGELQEA